MNHIDAKEDSHQDAAAPPPKFDQRHIGAAASKLVAASIGDIVTVFSRSPAHRHFSLADVEWMILPAVLNGQFYVAEFENRQTGFRAPIAVATWAFVSEEVDRRICANPSQRIRLRPDEWKSGDIAWIVDLVGDPRGVAGAVEWLNAEPFKERGAKIAVGDRSGAIRIDTLDALTIAPHTKEAAP
ncbi:toxin-activating lysine-acyltransferase [Rhodoblastus sp.]